MFRRRVEVVLLELVHLTLKFEGAFNNDLDSRTKVLELGVLDTSS